jgi:hypothetical protein
MSDEPSAEKRTAEERVRALFEHDGRTAPAGLFESDYAVLTSDAVRIAEEHAEAAVAEMRRERDAARAEAERLREALVPFTEHWGEWIVARADHTHPDTPGKPSWRNYVTVRAHIDRAKAALAQEPRT